MTQADALTPDKPPKTKRRWFQYSLRTLMAATAVIAVWLGLWSNSARKQREAVAALRKIGAEVTYDFELRGLKHPSQWPVWLVDTMGVDYFADVTHVGFQSATDLGLEHLKGLTALDSLGLDGSQVTDVGLKHLMGLTGLEWLNLDDTKVTDAGLEHFNGLTKLRNLYLDGTKVTDRGLEYLQGLTSLQILRLDGTQTTNAGLEKLKNLTALKWLDLTRTEVTDAGLTHIKGMTKLQELWLHSTKVIDDGVAQLIKSLPNCKIVFR